MWSNSTIQNAQHTRNSNNNAEMPAQGKDFHCVFFLKKNNHNNNIVMHQSRYSELEIFQFKTGYGDKRDRLS